MKTFGERVKELRIEKNLSQQALGNIFHVTKAAVCNWEISNRFPDEELLKQLANYFEVSLDYLLGRTEIRHVAIKEHVIDGEEIRIGINESMYPDGLTHEQVIKILESLKNSGIDLNPKK